MAADNLWWSVWWPWVVVWVVALVALLLAVAILVVQWRGQKQRAQQPPYLSFYLHEQSVMDLYQYKYRGALEQEVESRLGTRGRVSAGSDVPMVRFGGSLERNREEFRKYLERAEPITVIGILMDVLSDDLVHIDLERNSIVPARNIELRQRKIRLSEVGGRTYVLARGVFHQNPGPSGAVTTFLAPYGDQASAVVRVRCAKSGLRSDVPDGQWWARCLGTVQGWDRATHQLIVDPIAIFK